MHVTQLSYSVNAVLTEVAVRDSEGGLSAEAEAKVCLSRQKPKPACGRQARSEKTECTAGNAL